jgi:hypothetical protein
MVTVMLEPVGAVAPLSGEKAIFVITGSFHRISWAYHGIVCAATIDEHHLWGGASVTVLGNFSDMIERRPRGA